MKINLLILTLSAVVSVTACGSNDQKQTSQQKTESLETENNIKNQIKKWQKQFI
jgi:FtsZ-binding cell division protein ZapB